MAIRLAELRFDNRFTDELPADPMDLNRPRQVHQAAYSRVLPAPTTKPVLLAYSKEMLAELGLDSAVVHDEEFVKVMSGNATLESMNPHALCYGGHQFGNWAGQLGDGRAITLGEVVTSNNRRHTLQLKGAGPTPYSRSADGLAVLRSSVREFLCSEAMHHLGVPTTRALSLTTTGDQVLRDMFYDGRPEFEAGAVVCRVAPSFIRFGNFELFASRGDLHTLRKLADHSIVTHFGELGAPGPDTYTRWFAEIAHRTADMIVHWQRVGFVHGVMNTDNMSIHGLTIDYGPYGWLEDYNPGWTPNTTDRQFKRYRYGAQPHIAQWNLTCLANAIYPLVGEVEPLQSALGDYVNYFNSEWLKMMAAKLGIAQIDPERDPALIEDLLVLLARIETDMTLFFRALAEVPINEAMPETDPCKRDAVVANPTALRETDPVDGDELIAVLNGAYYDPNELRDDVRNATLDWLRRYRARLACEPRPDKERRAEMNSVNPLYVPRNYLVQLAIDDADKGDPSAIEELLNVWRRPYDQQRGKDSFAEKRPDWARTRPGCSMLSCSS